MRTRTIALIVVVFIAVAGGEYYLQSSRASSGPSPLTIDISIIGGVGVGTTDRYAPANFTVHQGQQVTLAVLNTDDNTHGLAIDAYKIDTGIILGGHTGRVTFVANQTGTYRYYEPPGYCKGGYGNTCNSVQDMIGYMTVSP
jgi:plastocyanin